MEEEENINENFNSQNEAEEVETSEEETTEESEKISDELTDREKQFLARAKKAESKLKAQKEEKVEKKPKKEDKSNEFGLVEKGYLKAAGITDADEIDLAKKLMEETGKELDVLIESKYFQSELKDLQDAKATTKATSGVRGGTGGGTKANESPEYWISKGVPPTKNDVPDRKARVKIHRAMMQNSATGGKKFYND